MSRLEELLQTLCPDGVENKQLGNIGSFYGGLTGKTKQDFQDGNRKFISYMNVYKNSAVDTTTRDFVRIEAGERQNTVEYGDILFTGSSETPEECGITSVMVKHPDEPFYLNSFTIGYRLHDPNLLNPEFSKHLFRSDGLRKQINKTANGVTRFNVSKAKLAGVEIPLPPLPVQEEIVRILDTFTNVVEELETELGARVRQYEYYRDGLLNFNESDITAASSPKIRELIQTLCPDGVEYKKIKEGYRRLKGTPITAGKMKEIDNPSGEIKIFAGGRTVINAAEKDIPNSNVTRLPAVLVQSRGVIDAIYYDKPFTFKNEMWAYTTENKISVKYLYYVLKSNLSYFRGAASGMGSLPQISLRVTEEFLIPVPPLPVQEEIVRILNRFDTLVNDLKSGLPAEIAARRKQYEYYRDKLLTFPPLK